MTNPRRQFIPHPSLTDAPLTVNTDEVGDVLAVSDEVSVILGVSPRTLRQQNLLMYFPADHAQLSVALLAVSTGPAAPAPIPATLYPKERARIAVTIQLASPESSSIVWSIMRRRD
jgi:hypothetical protein